MEMPTTSKISRTLNRYGHLKSVTDRPELDIVKIAFFGVAIAALTRFLSYGINSDLTDAFAWANIKKWTLILTLMFVSSVALMYFFFSLLRRRNRETTELKAKVVEAIHQALDQSSFNPHLNKQNERTR
ncbi:MAG TPA: hypothetical protein VN844_25065 [Pyrinomonadaceae bacterium]|nr:hypothetical protein [Pyrinomonadaceae bacterium]